MSWSKFKPSYLRVGGRTKPFISALVQNLSLSTYGWKDELSHLRVLWSKIKILLLTGGRTNQATSKCLDTKFKSFYLRVEGRIKSQVPWSKFKVLLPTSGRTNQATYYLQVEGLTKPLASALVQNLSPSTYE